MRWISWLALAAGCQVEGGPKAAESPLELQYRAEVQTTTDGFAIADDGQDGWAGIHGAVCKVNGTGGITDDVDPGSGTETIGDATGTGDSLVSVALGRSHLFSVGHQGHVHDGGHFSHAQAAGVTATGLAVLRDEDDGSCTIDWTTDHGEVESSTALPDGCGSALSTSHDGVIAVVADPTSAVIVGPDGVIPTGTGADLVAWDDESGVAYLATRGETVVRAVQSDGTELWSVDVGDPIRAIDDAGAHAAVVVSVRTADGGALRILDAQTGEILLDEATPSGAAQLATSRDGSTLAVVVTDAVYLFDLQDR